MILLRYYEDTGELVEVTSDEIDQQVKDQNKKNDLADFIFKRHYYRYIKPFEYKSPKKIKSKSSGKDGNKYSLLYKNGFSIMANCCLLIETLETFYRGWPNSNNKSELTFLKFFTRDNNFKEFSSNDMPTVFYKNIRCGILHQGETTNGWQITRDDEKDLLDIKNKKINASKFIETLKKSLEEYKEELENSDWDDEVWKSAKTKIKAIVKASKG